MWSHAVFPLLVVTAPVVERSSPAAASNPALENARAARAALLYDDVLRHLDAALQLPSSHAQLVEIYEMAGLTNAALARDNAARNAFERLLMIEPGHQLPSHVSPRLREPFEEMRREQAKNGAIRVAVGGPASVEPGKPLQLAVRLDNDPLQMVDRFRVNYRLAGGGDARTTVVPAAATAQVWLELDTAKLAQRGAVEYWMTLLDRSGSELVHWGTSEKAMVVAFEAAAPPPPPAEPMSIWRSPWLWSGVGGAAAIGLTGVLLYALSARSPSCEGMYGCDELAP